MYTPYYSCRAGDDDDDGYCRCPTSETLTCKKPCYCWCAGDDDDDEYYDDDEWETDSDDEGMPGAITWIWLCVCVGGGYGDRAELGRKVMR